MSVPVQVGTGSGTSSLCKANGSDATHQDAEEQLTTQGIQQELLHHLNNSKGMQATKLDFSVVITGALPGPARHSPALPFYCERSCEHGSCFPPVVGLTFAWYCLCPEPHVRTASTSAQATTCPGGAAEIVPFLPTVQLSTYLCSCYSTSPLINAAWFS